LDLNRYGGKEPGIAATAQRRRRGGAGTRRRRGARAGRQPGRAKAVRGWGGNAWQGRHRRWRGAAGKGGRRRSSRGAGEQGRRQRRKKEEERSQGLICETKELQGLHCDELITFKPVLKRENDQNESCKTFQNL
jgi:hypothetical protein